MFGIYQESVGKFIYLLRLEISGLDLSRFTCNYAPQWVLIHVNLEETEPLIFGRREYKEIRV
jgi:hypothetical protein